jgi:sialic acid synthase SpsE
MVEKHFTLSRQTDGLDDPIAMDPTMFTAMSAAIRRVDAILELDPVAGSDKTLSEFRAEYGEERIDEILGDGVKVVAEAERGNYATTRRSVIALHNIRAGSTIGNDEVAALRAEKNARPGVEPRYIGIVRGARAVRSVDAGQGVRWDDIIAREG